jgi:hypothetical protein
MALHFESHGPTIADIDYASILFTSFYQDFGTGGRELPELSTRILIGAMLAPHH